MSESHPKLNQIDYNPCVQIKKVIMSKSYRKDLELEESIPQ